MKQKIGKKSQPQTKHLSYLWSTYATFHQCANNKHEAKLRTGMERNGSNSWGCQEELQENKLK